MSFMDEFECSFMFPVWCHYPGSLQDNTIFNGQLFSKGPVYLNLNWHFCDDAWLSMGDGMFQECKLIIFLCGNPHFIQAVTSSI